MTWDQRWMQLTDTVRSWSKDRSTQGGAVIVDSRQVLLSIGWNGFPRNVDDSIDERHVRPAKYLFMEHAERNSCYNAAAKGIELQGSTLYTSLYPCADCARAIIQCGIVRLVSREPDFNDPRWKEHFLATKKMFAEVNLKTDWWVQ